MFESKPQLRIGIPSGGGMGKIFRLVLLACICAVPVARVAVASNGDAMARQLKLQQKQEMRALKAQHHMQERSMKQQRVDRATRTTMKHRMQREERELREKHHDQMQDLKDQIRMVRANRGR
jgi:hypothetical protein